MSSQERQDYQFYEQNQKEEIPQILNQKQGKKIIIKIFKEEMEIILLKKNKIIHQ